MFTRKYVFETKKTRKKRVFRVLLFLMIFPVFIYLGTGLFFILSGLDESKQSQEQLYKKAPDLITVFTGDQGRIKFALDKAKEYKVPRILISGVYSKNSIKTLLEKHAPDFMKTTDAIVDEEGNETSPAIREIDPNKIEIDYLASNTIENVLSVFRYMRKNPAFKTVLIISSDYHIPRIKFITNEIRTKRQDFEVFYLGKESDYSKWRSQKILIKEVTKYIKAWGFLLFWSDEGGPEIEATL